MRLHPRSLLAVLPIATGCGTVVGPPPHPGRIAIIEALLIGGTEATPFRLTWADDEATLFRPAEPIAPAEVRLALTGSSGPPSPLVPRPDSAGLFLAWSPIVPGGRYRLDGTIAGRAIAAVTTIPTAFTVVTPIGDIDARTVGVSEPFHWRATGATVFATDYAVFGESQYHHTRDTSGAMRITPISPAISPALTVWAMNADAERYLYHVTAPQSNLTGALGVLGGALVVRRTFRWH